MKAQFKGSTPRTCPTSIWKNFAKLQEEGP